MYIASDSRIGWVGRSILGAWDVGRKTFAATNQPDIFGYCGDVQFPTMVLSQIVALIDSYLIFDNTVESDERFEKVSSIIKTSYDKYPDRFKNNFTIIYGNRLGEDDVKATFNVYEISWNNAHWAEKKLIVPSDKSSIIGVYGSGVDVIEKFKNIFGKSDFGIDTSRGIFSAFCSAVESGEDGNSGGKPQTVGLYKIGNSRIFGFESNRSLWVYGLPIDQLFDVEKIEWRNERFERVDARKMAVQADAQRHPLR